MAPKQQQKQAVYKAKQPTQGAQGATADQQLDRSEAANYAREGDV
jgi:hypothetical protein